MTILCINKENKLLQATLQTNFQRLMNFLGFAKSYCVRNNPVNLVLAGITAVLKNLLTIRKKGQMVKYRVGHQLYQLRKMEELIAENNQHLFLQGKNLNETR